MHISSLIKNTLRKFGVEINRFNASSSPTAQLVASLQKFDIDFIFDVGANAGQFVTEIRSGGYMGNVVSFEPLSFAWSALQKAREGDLKWEAYPRCALGDKDGEIEINIAGNSASSSVLPMLDSHLSAAPHTSYVGKEKVSLLTLDGVAPAYIEKYHNPFLKIDTQGFEWTVLDGATNILPQIRGVLLELSLIPLYEGQYLWEDVVLRMKHEGFTLWAIQPMFTDPHNGRTLQFDGIFFRIP